jgi:hypothetical protein
MTQDDCGLGSGTGPEAGTWCRSARHPRPSVRHTYQLRGITLRVAAVLRGRGACKQGHPATLNRPIVTRLKSGQIGVDWPVKRRYPGPEAEPISDWPDNRPGGPRSGRASVQSRTSHSARPDHHRRRTRRSATNPQFWNPTGNWRGARASAHARAGTDGYIAGPPEVHARSADSGAEGAPVPGDWAGWLDSTADAKPARGRPRGGGSPRTAQPSGPPLPGRQERVTGEPCRAGCAVADSGSWAFSDDRCQAHACFVRHPAGVDVSRGDGGDVPGPPGWAGQGRLAGKPARRS